MLKKIALWLLMAAVLGALVGGVALKEMNVTMNDKQFQLGDLFKNGVSTPVHEEESVTIETLTELKVRGISEDIEIVYEDRQDVFVVLEGDVTQPEGMPLPKMVVRSIGEKVTVEMADQNVIGGFNLRYNMTLTVHVPNTFKPKLDLESVSGNINANVYADSDVKSVSGNLNVTGFNKAMLKAESTSGNIRVDGSTGEMKLKSISGDLDCQIESVAGNIDAETVSGGVELTMMAIGEGFKFKGESTSGDISVKVGNVNTKADSFEALETVVGDGTHTFRVHTVSGDITVKD